VLDVAGEAFRNQGDFPRNTKGGGERLIVEAEGHSQPINESPKILRRYEGDE
jgi:hypothetical protein